MLLYTCHDSGGTDGNSFYSAIFRYNPAGTSASTQWTAAGHMREKRGYPAVTVVDRATVGERCY